MRKSQTDEFSRTIPTEYRGVKLKSRMEAQCAYLFDCLGWGWEYEPRSYMVGGIGYTPDFFIECEAAFVECRGYDSEKGSKQIDGFGELITTGDGIELSVMDFSQVYLVIGPSEVRHYYCYFDSEVPSPGKFCCNISVAFCEACGEWVLIRGIYCNRCIKTAFHRLGSINVLGGKILFNGMTSDQWGDYL